MKKTAFNLNLLVILLFLASGYLFGITLFYVVSIVFLTILPACSTKS